MKTFTFNNDELNALLGLIDIAVKAGGLQVARNAIYFQDKFTKDENKEAHVDAFMEPETQAEEPVED